MEKFLDGKRKVTEREQEQDFVHPCKLYTIMLLDDEARIDMTERELAAFIKGPVKNRDAKG